MMFGLIAVCVMISCVPLLASRSSIDPHTTLGCHRREYTFRATRTDPMGQGCWDKITVMSCWGRCDSGEIADWRFPFKKHFHPVCIFGERIRRIATLRYCDEGVEEKFRKYEYYEAGTCVCQVCESSETSCEGIPHGRATKPKAYNT